jgi:hypothetical protein
VKKSQQPGKPLDKQRLKIRENSWLAKIAAYKLGARRVALVLGDTVHLCRVSRGEFLEDEAWVKHECCHIRQFRQYGFFNFLLKYLWESLRKGYYNNKYEIEARKAETE